MQTYYRFKCFVVDKSMDIFLFKPIIFLKLSEKFISRSYIITESIVPLTTEPQEHKFTEKQLLV